jgi:hypothetical protein
LKIEKLEKKFIWGPPNDAAININNVLSHEIIQQIDVNDVLSQI